MGKLGSTVCVVAIAPLLIGGILWEANRSWNHTGASSLVPSGGGPEPWRAAPIRERPLRLPVRNDLQALVRDEDLRMVLEAAVPRWDPPTVPIMLHALRLWGDQAQFPVPADAPSTISNCSEFRRILLRNDECVRVVGKFDEFLIPTRYGIRVLSAGDPIKRSRNSEGHYDQLLKALGESGVPATEEVLAAGGHRAVVADLMRDSLARFSLLQELEFTSCAYARWLPPVREWHNRFGERYTFDDLVNSLVAQPLGKGACQGCHVPYALVSIYLANKEYPELLTTAARRQLENRLREISECLEANQVPGGGWDKRWSGAYVDDPENVFFEFKPHFDRISATGHHLEWIALVAPELRPRPVVVHRAVRALITELANLSEDDLRKPKGYLPLTHAARALCLTRGQDRGFPLWQQLQEPAAGEARVSDD